MTGRFSRPLLHRIVSNAGKASSNLHVSRMFANTTNGSNEALKVDFKRWMKKEIVLLAFMITAGATGVRFYQNRESAPMNQVKRLVKEAGQCAEEGDRKQALRRCLEAYDVIKSTNPHDRHLFEMAFAIAAQYESLGRSTLATKYYLDALEHNIREMKVAKRGRNSIVTLDRIAQSYENRGQIRTAENYYKQSINAYNQNQGLREISKIPKSEAADFAELDREIPAVLYNYLQLLMADKRWKEASNALQRAMTLARASSLSEEYVKLIEDAITSVQMARARENNVEVEQSDY